MAQAKQKLKLPATLGAAVDYLYEMRTKRLALFAVVEQLKSLEHAAKLQLMRKFGKAKLQGAAGSRASMTLTANDVPTPKDWKKIYAHIKKTGDFDLLQKRLSNDAVKARWANNKAIPGVEVFHDTKISVTKKAGRK